MIVHKNEKINRSLNKICNFYAGKGHFFITVLSYIINSVKEGTKAVIFLDTEMHEDLPAIIRNIYGNSAYELWQKNVVIFPNKLIKKFKGIKKAEYQLKNIVKFINCYQYEDLIICIQNANNVSVKFIDYIENLLINLEMQAELINCYEFDMDKKSILEILSGHDYILNTAGLCKVEETYKELLTVSC